MTGEAPETDKKFTPALGAAATEALLLAAEAALNATEWPHASESQIYGFRQLRIWTDHALRMVSALRAEIDPADAERIPLETVTLGFTDGITTHLRIRDSDGGMVIDRDRQPTGP